MNTSYYKKGFTLVETLVAITVLLLVVIGPMTVAQKGIQTAYFATEQATAVFLAQEAIEAVRMLRDNNALVVYDNESGDTSSWIDHSNLYTCKNESGCAYLGEGGFDSCTARNNCKLKKDSETGKYSYDSVDPDSLFTRVVQISESPASSGNVKATVTVTWKGRVFGGDPKSVVLQTWIYDQYSRYE